VGRVKPILLRDATPADDAAIGELLVRAFVDSYAQKLPQVRVTEERKTELRNVARKRAVARVWVADRGGEVVGTVALWPPGAAGSEAFFPGAADLRHLGLDASVRGQNVSGLLLDAAEAFARQLACPAVCLHVRREALGVRRLYERRGYQRHPEGDLDLLPDVFLEAFALKLSL
jgi:predicted N-acetyltransferase YhbS